MKTYSSFLEDLQQRKELLAQRKIDQMARMKEKGAKVNTAASQRLAAQQQSNAQDDAEALRKKQEWEAKRKAQRAAAQEAKDKAEEENRKKEAMKDEIKQDLEREREDRRKAIETKRMEKERAQAEKD